MVVVEEASFVVEDTSFVVVVVVEETSFAVVVVEEASFVEEGQVGVEALVGS